MIILGLTGGVASGKSYVAQLLAQRGAQVLDADRHARDALDDPAIKHAIVQRWGDAVTDERGGFRRSAIAGRVFGEHPDAEADRLFLEGLVHPFVRTRLREELRIAEEADASVAVLDVPLLLESGWVDECDAVVFVDTPAEVRARRAQQRGWSRAELALREAAQRPIDEKRAAADYVVPGGDEESSAAGIAEVWGDLVGGADRRVDPET